MNYFAQGKFIISCIKIFAWTPVYVVVILVTFSTIFIDHVQASVTNTRADDFGTLELSEDDSGNMGGLGVNVYSNGSSSAVHLPQTDNYVITPSNNSIKSGIKWQCVELVNRLYLTKGWTSQRWPGNGNEMFGNASSMGLTALSQGSITNVLPGDAIFLDDKDHDYGHAAYVSSVSGSNISVANQNTTAVFFNTTLTNGVLSSPWSDYTVQGIVRSPASGSTYTAHKLTQIEKPAGGGGRRWRTL